MASSFCDALTNGKGQCKSKGKYLFGDKSSCGIASHVMQVRKMTGVGVDVAPLPVTAAKKKKVVAGTKIVGEYSLASKLGKGAYGTVYEAAKGEDGKERYAVKQQPFIDKESGVSVSALVEADVMCRFRHPNLVRVEEVFLQKDNINYVMEKATTTWRSIPSSAKTPDNIKKFAFQLVSAISFLHEGGVIHADIKPENILLVQDATTKEWTVKLTDFGLGQYHAGQDKTLRIQTFWYRSPEIWEKVRRYGPAVDMWSVGLVLRELLTSHPLSSSQVEKSYYTTIKTLLGDVPSIEKGLAPSLSTGWDKKEWSEFMRLINACLSYNASTRIDADTFLSSSLFSSFVHPVGKMLAPCPPSPLQFTLTHNKMREWSALHLPSCQRATMVLAMQMLDRCSDEEDDTALACLSLALKLMQRSAIPTPHFSTMMGREWFLKDMVQAEERVITELRWMMVLPSTSLSHPYMEPEDMWILHKQEREKVATPTDT